MDSVLPLVYRSIALWLYPHGLRVSSSGDFREALAVLFGPDAAGLTTDPTRQIASLDPA